MDIGCSNHITENKQRLINFNYNKRTRIKCADDEYLTAKGMGNVLVKMKDGIILLIENVWYVPSMKRNPMSVDQLLEKGYSMTMEDNLLKLYNYEKKLIMQYVLEKNKTFKMNVETTETQRLSAIDIEKENAL